MSSNASASLPPVCQPMLGGCLTAKVRRRQRGGRGRGRWLSACCDGEAILWSEVAVNMIVLVLVGGRWCVMAAV